MKKTVKLLSLFLSLCLFLSLGAVGLAAGSTPVTWQDYLDFLWESFQDTAPDPDALKTLLDSTPDWATIEASLTDAPWCKFFDPDVYDATTWEEFQANGGVGTFNADAYDDPNYESDAAGAADLASGTTAAASDILPVYEINGSKYITLSDLLSLLSQLTASSSSAASGQETAEAGKAEGVPSAGKSEAMPSADTAASTPTTGPDQVVNGVRLGDLDVSAYSFESLEAMGFDMTPPD